MMLARVLKMLLGSTLPQLTRGGLGAGANRLSLKGKASVVGGFVQSW